MRLFFTLGSSFCLSVVAASACGRTETATPTEDAGAIPPDSSSPDSATRLLAPVYFVASPGPDGRRDTVWVEASYKDSKTNDEPLPPSTSIAVNGVRLIWERTGEASEAYVGHLAYATNDIYRYLVQHGGKAYSTDAKLARGEIVTPARNATVNLTSPLVVAWDRDLSAAKVEVALRSSCISPKAVFPSSITARSATFELTLDLDGGAGCEVSAELSATTDAPLDLGPPFQPGGRVITRFEAPVTSFTLTP